MKVVSVRLLRPSKRSADGSEEVGWDCRKGVW